MAARAWKGVHLGYRTGSNQYRIYHAEKKKVFERRDIEFHEGKTPIEKEDSGEHTDSETDPEKGNQIQWVVSNSEMTTQKVNQKGVSRLSLLKTTTA